ncbi:hypothetical protein MKX47_07170 [Solibacillus sp. FSL R7-0668]|uniref:hypothetical protein n=1 Tax=Solibacillus sp. FSL R7-0668 TaxID=2921688 RepID=UPI0030F4BBE8
MLKRLGIFIFSSILLLGISGCDDAVDDKNEIWEQSPVFESGGYTMIGEEGRLGFIYDESEVMKFYPNKTQKYMWHFWGDEQELDGKFTVMATNQDDGEQVPLLTVDHLSGPNNGADRHIPSHLTLPKEGMWKLDAYIEEKLFGTIYVEVHKE